MLVPTETFLNAVRSNLAQIFTKKILAEYILLSFKFPVAVALRSAHYCAFEADRHHRPAKTNPVALRHPHAASRDLTVGSHGGKGAWKSTCCHA